MLSSKEGVIFQPSRFRNELWELGSVLSSKVIGWFVMRSTKTNLVCTVAPQTGSSRNEVQKEFMHQHKQFQSPTRSKLGSKKEIMWKSNKIRTNNPFDPKKLPSFSDTNSAQLLRMNLLSSGTVDRKEPIGDVSHTKSTEEDVQKTSRPTFVSSQTRNPPKSIRQEIVSFS